ncbi:unnamed protein product, partial [Allacma fusca]
KSQVTDNGYGASFSEAAVSSSDFKGGVEDKTRNDPSDETAAILNGLFSDIDPPNRLY